VASTGIALSLSPIAQDPSYHQFADQRTLWGIPNFWNVVSNVGFLIVGVLGSALLYSKKGRSMFDAPRENWPFHIFFTAVVLVCIGSAYYHYNPNNETLFWDRLPMTIGFAALLCSFVVDRISTRMGVSVVLPLSLLLGILSVIYWYVTEISSQGDLRLYGVVQFYPMVAIPLICFLFPGRNTSGAYVYWLVFWYSLAKICEQFDHEVYALLGTTVSGHTLKHVFGAIGAYVILMMLRAAASANPDTTHSN
jgi:hypothetical protein